MEADLLAIYGIRDWDEELDAPTFFILAQRVFAYEGVMSSRLLKKQIDEKKQEDEPPPLTRNDPALQDLIEWG